MTCSGAAHCAVLVVAQVEETSTDMEGCGERRQVICRSMF